MCLQLLHCKIIINYQKQIKRSLERQSDWETDWLKEKLPMKLNQNSWVIYLSIGDIICSLNN